MPIQFSRSEVHCADLTSSLAYFATNQAAVFAGFARGLL
jgi:hypothetical protein